MCVIDASDVILEYLYQRKSITKDNLMKEVDTLCKKLVEKGVYTAIDFNYYDEGPTSDIINEKVNDFMYSKILDESHSETTYAMTEYGVRVSPFLLYNFRENQKTAYKIYMDIITTL